MNVIDRVKEFIVLRKLSVSGFEKSLGLANNTIQKAIKRSGSVKDDTMNKILEVYPEINPIWLLMGKGDMILNESNQNHVKEGEPVYNRETGIDAQFEEMFARYLKSPKAKNEINKIVATQISGITDKLGLLILDNEIKAEIEKAVAENLKEQEVKQ